MDLGLKGKNVLITGAAGGIGRAVANILASEGSNIVVNDMNLEAVKSVAQSLQDTYNIDALPVVSDFSKDNSAEDLFNESIEHFQKLDVLVNCAGVWPTSYVKDMTAKEFEDTMHINLEIPFILSKLMANHLVETKRKGKIVHVVSQAAFHGSTTGHAHYAASKAGLVTFMKSHAREVAKYGININAVAPGIVRTRMTEENLKKYPDYYVNRIPVGRVAEPSDVANAVVFLASNKADYFTGITFDATGGMLMR